MQDLGSAGNQSKPVVLVFEPSTYLARALYAKLESFGYSVTVEANLKQLYQKTRQVMPSLVISEVILPLTFQHCRLLRKDPLTKFLPILLHTANPAGKTVMKALEAGVTGVVEKPASVDTLHGKIAECLGGANGHAEQVSPAKEKMDRISSLGSKIKTLLSDNAEFKAIPNAVVKALQITNDETTGAADLAKVVTADPSIAATILRRANSQYYGGVRKISELNEAIARIGFEESRRILIGMSVFKMFDAQNRSVNFSRKGFWEHSLACGCLAAMIARKTQKANESKAFTAGLLHDIGKLLFDERVDPEFERAVEAATQEGRMLCDAELDAFGFTHNQLGYAFLKGSNLPDEITQVAYHHNSSNFQSQDLSESTMSVIKIVWISNVLAKAAGFSGAGDMMLGNFPNNLGDSLNLSTDFRAGFLKELNAEVSDYKAFLGIKSDEPEFPGLSRSKKRIVYYNPIGQTLDVVEIFLQREQFSVQRSASLEECLQLLRVRPAEAILLVQTNTDIDLSELAVHLKTLPSDVSLMCMGNKAELRILESMNVSCDKVYWPLNAGRLRSALLDSMQD